MAKMVSVKKLRVWWIPQVPMNKFYYVSVDSVIEAKKILNLLADYDKFQFKNKIKPDYSNTGGLEIFEDNEWFEYEDHNGNDIWYEGER